MKKVLITSYESGQVFVEAPTNTSRNEIFQAVREYVQEKTKQPVITLSNYTYETESEWKNRKLQDEEKGLRFVWDSIPVITLQNGGRSKND